MKYYESKYKKRLLELFSGTHSIGKVAKKNYIVYSLDLDLPEYDKTDKEKKYKSDHHFQEDILTWDYKQFPPGYFHIITASPVCKWWSMLRNTWIGRKMKGMTENVSKEFLQADIEKYGVPMVDKTREIINYFNPLYWWIENPNGSKMKKYITDLDYYIVDYCKYSNWGYMKRTRFWTNIKGFNPKICKKDCENIMIIKNKKQHNIVLANGYELDKDGNKILCNTKKLRDKYKKEKKCHEKSMGSWYKIPGQKGIGGGSNRLERYRIPPSLISELLNLCV